MRNQILTLAVLSAISGAAAAADVGANTTVGSQIFLDFSNIKQQSQSAAGVYADTGSTGTGFDVKRAYLIVDHKFDDVWSADLTTDAQYSSSTTAGSGGVTEVFIKRLYLQAKINDALVVHAGSYTSPWAPFVESLYGYRFVEKTATDRLGFANTADWGLNATGALADGIVTYSGSIVNGGGYKNPSRSKDVDFEGRVGVTPVKWFTIGGGFYDGHLGQINATNENFPNNTARRWDLVAGVNAAGLRVGGEYFNAKNYKTVATLTGGVFGTSSITTSSATAPFTDTANGFSTWASYAFNPTWSVFARYDDVKLSKDRDPSLKDTYFNLGVDYKPSKPLDLALVYKDERVKNGAASISGADANGSYSIGGANATTNGKFDEIGVFAQVVF